MAVVVHWTASTRQQRHHRWEWVQQRQRHHDPLLLHFPKSAGTFETTLLQFYQHRGRGSPTKRENDEHKLQRKKTRSVPHHSSHRRVLLWSQDRQVLLQSTLSVLRLHSGWRLWPSGIRGVSKTCSSWMGENLWVQISSCAWDSLSEMQKQNDKHRATQENTCHPTTKMCTSIVMSTKASWRWS